MAIKHICDRCGSEDGVGRFTMSFAVSAPHSTESLPKNVDGDLCRNCFGTVCASIKAAIQSTVGKP